MTKNMTEIFHPFPKKRTLLTGEFADSPNLKRIKTSTLIGVANAGTSRKQRRESFIKTPCLT